MSSKAIIFDRDGTLIEHVPYLCQPILVKVLPCVTESILTARQSGAMLFLHTNQSGVSRELYKLEDVHAVNERMLELFELGPNVFDKICVATEHPDSPPIYRKPSPRFAFEVMQEYGFAPDEITYIGDRVTDLETALAAGTRGVGVATGLIDLRAEVALAKLPVTFPICDNLFEAVTLALGDSNPQ
jgi:D-glycero-D-manno-heptose 1,7-bisphosphate phosphatase